jgi:hypothetical protein
MRKNLILLVLLVFGCCIDQRDYSLKSVVASPLVDIPLVSGELSIQDILNQTDSGFVRISPDSVIYLDYTTSLISQELQSQFTLPDKSTHQSFTLTQETVQPHPTDLRADSVMLTIDLDLSPEQLSAIDFKSGTINFNSQATASPGIDYDVIITSTDFISKSTGNSLSVTAGNGSLPMDDYRVNLNKNQFELKMVLVYKATSQQFNINHPSTVEVQFNLSGMNFNLINGFLGDHVFFSPEAMIAINAFGQSLRSADISFAQPIVAFTVINDYGAPLTVSFLEFEARKTGSRFGGQLNPASPVAVQSPASPNVSSVTSINASNTSQLVDFGPTGFYYRISGEIDAGLNSGTNFLTDTSKLRVNLNVSIPLWGHVSKISLADTSSIDLSKLDQSQVESASLKVTISNQLPLAAKVQCYLADVHYVILDSLLTTGETELIKGSTVNSSGNLVSVGSTDLVIPLNPSAVSKIITSPYIIVTALMNTSVDATGKSEDVKFKSGYTIKINLGLSAKMKASITF